MNTFPFIPSNPPSSRSLAWKWCPRSMEPAEQEQTKPRHIHRHASCIPCCWTYQLLTHNNHIKQCGNIRTVCAHRVLANTRNGGLVKRGHLRVDELCGQLRWESSEQWRVFNWNGAAFKYVERCHSEYEGWYNETERNPRTTVHWKNLSCMKKKWKGERNPLVPVATESCS